MTEKKEEVKYEYVYFPTMSIYTRRVIQIGCVAGVGILVTLLWLVTI